MIYSAEIKLWGNTVGAVSLDEGQKYASFEYAPSFLQSGIQVAPISMPLKSGVYRFPELPYESFHGLPGLLSDSLPDKFGNELINAWLSKNGRLPESFNAIERLCYTGKRGMGALEFFPLLQNEGDEAEAVSVSNLVELSNIVLANRKNLSAVFDECDKRALSKSLAQIIKVGTSAGGARAKALVAINPKTGEVKSGQVEVSGFEYYLIKFSGVSKNGDKDGEDALDFGKIEYAYYLMARACGIEMSPSRLLDDGKRKHFITKRFDRTDDGKKIHMQTLGGMAHFDFNQSGQASYEQAFSVMARLGLYYPDFEQLYKRMLFNVLCKNCDDHVKNISFLMDKSGAWRLSPAYDVCFAYNPAGIWTSRHQMTINGKQSGFLKEDFSHAAKLAGLTLRQQKRCAAELLDGIKKWKDFAAEAGVDEGRAAAMEGLFEKRVLE